ncbi:GAF and ANTAR domain-containing protein [Blastococcus xanthinilyticus]|uniref:GAF domain-containing protein n=1 Tax=Blastococcus xanthinilyticus TaxID=1564164 RepID=A0A5S5D3Q9_9ACTN|nr:GAF and ANTAR domain-containing protein [Blastococcus xanthinilyticus]TYP90667.1 GAF domain-containing protein [Blastococcus xanthinilyticus]
MAAAASDPRGTPGATHLADVMSRTARRLQEEHGDVEATLQAVTVTAVEIVPGAAGCSISYVIGRSTVEPRASTGDLSRSLDLLQGRLGQGPCMDAVWETDAVRVDDLAADDRWPLFAREAAGRGVGSMLCFRLFVERNRLGAMNLYGRKPGTFDDVSQDVGHLLAAHAAVALAGAEHEAQLRAAVGSRDAIGQAKGILMERHKLTADQAFAVLARVSQELNRKLTDVAAELTDTGAVPGGARRRD